MSTYRVSVFERTDEGPERGKDERDWCKVLEATVTGLSLPALTALLYPPPAPVKRQHRKREGVTP